MQNAVEGGSRRVYPESYHTEPNNRTTQREAKTNRRRDKLEEHDSKKREVPDCCGPHHLTKLDSITQRYSNGEQDEEEKTITVPESAQPLARGSRFCRSNKPGSDRKSVV